MTLLDSRYSYITSIGSLICSSTLTFIYGKEIHGRGLAEGPTLIFWGMLELRAGAVVMYVPSLNFKYGHFPFWGVVHVPLPGWYLLMLQFHLALCCFFKAMFLKKCVIIGCTYVWSSSEISGIKLINSYSLSLNGIWVNSPWGWRPNRLLTQRPWGREE